MDSLSQDERLRWQHFLDELAQVKPNLPYLAVVGGNSIRLCAAIRSAIRDQSLDLPVTEKVLYAASGISELFAAPSLGKQLLVLVSAPELTREEKSRILAELVIKRDLIGAIPLQVVCIWDDTTFALARSMAVDWVNMAQFVYRFTDFDQQLTQELGPEDDQKQLQLLRQTEKNIEEQLQEEIDLREIINLHLQAADQAERSGQYTRAERHLLRAKKGAMQLNDGTLLVNTLNRMGLIRDRQGDFQEAIAYFNQSIDTADTIGDLEGKINGLINRGDSNRLSGQWAAGRRDLEEAVAWSRGYHLTSVLATALNSLGGLYLDTEHPEQALNCFREALEINRLQNDREAVAINQGNIALVYDLIGEFEAAISAYRQALEQHQLLGNRRGQSDQLGNLGILYANRGDFEVAIRHHQRALEINQSINYLGGQAADLSNIGLVYFQMGELDTALSYFQRALTIDRQLGDEKSVAQSLANTGLIYHDQGRLISALDCQLEVEKINRKLGYTKGLAEDLVNIGMLFLDLQQPLIALDYLEQALTIDQSQNNDAGMASTFNNLGMVWTDLENYPLAEQLFHEALDRKRRLGLLDSQANTLSNLGTVSLRQDKIDQAKRYWQQAITIYEQIDSKSGIAVVSAEVGDLFRLEEDWEAATGYYEMAEALLREQEQWHLWRELAKKLAEVYKITQQAAALDQLLTTRKRLYQE